MSGEAEKAGVADEINGVRDLAARLQQIAQMDHAGPGQIPWRSARCATKGGSLRHLNRLCRHYRACLDVMRRELDRLLSTDNAANAESQQQSIDEIIRQAVRLIQWDIVLERSSYVGEAIHFRHLGRGLGLMCCERLAHNCLRVARLKGQGQDELLHWVGPPAWFAEVEAHHKSMLRVGWIACSSILLLGTAWAFWD